MLSRVMPTPLGDMLAIADEKVLNLLEFVDSENLDKHIHALVGDKPLAEGCNHVLDSIEWDIMGYFPPRDEDFVFETPIAFHGTDFQKQVWEVLLNIPLGETRTYAEVARLIGKPSAFRAVAQANAANKLALIVPCHRVINSNGSIGGYSGHVNRKKWLLQHEKVSSNVI